MRPPTLQDNSNEKYKIYHVTWKTTPFLFPPNAPATTQRPGASFLDLPGEIRNEIYKHALGMNCLRFAAKGPDRTEDGAIESVRHHTRFNILAVCHQIGYEAGKMFLNHAIAYIPVSTSFNLRGMQMRMFKGIALTNADYTMHAALQNVKDIHFHLHLHREDRYYSGGPIRQLKDLISHIRELSEYLSIRQAWGDPRNITVHLDHYFSKNYRAYLSTAVSLYSLFHQMGKAERVNWTLAYYVDTGLSSEEVPGTKWQNQRKSEFNQIAGYVKRQPNIKIRVEVLGCGKWEDAEMPAEWLRCATTEVTRQNMVWRPTDDIESPF